MHCELNMVCVLRFLNSSWKQSDINFVKFNKVIETALGVCGCNFKLQVSVQSLNLLCTKYQICFLYLSLGSSWFWRLYSWDKNIVTW